MRVEGSVLRARSSSDHAAPASPSRNARALRRGHASRASAAGPRPGPPGGEPVTPRLGSPPARRQRFALVARRSRGHDTGPGHAGTARPPGPGRMLAREPPATDGNRLFLGSAQWRCPRSCANCNVALGGTLASSAASACRANTRMEPHRCMSACACARQLGAPPSLNLFSPKAPEHRPSGRSVCHRPYIEHPLVDMHDEALAESLAKLSSWRHGRQVERVTALRLIAPNRQMQRCWQREGRQTAPLNAAGSCGLGMCDLASHAQRLLRESPEDPEGSGAAGVGDADRSDSEPNGGVRAAREPTEDSIRFYATGVGATGISPTPAGITSGSNPVGSACAPEHAQK
jgi:hypothetical protein